MGHPLGCVLLDRDGTIIHDREYLADPAGVELLPGAAQGLLRMRGLGLKLVVVTNQSGVGRGYFSEHDVRAVNGRMIELLREAGVELDAVLHCPHAPEAGCDCRKPAPGLAKQAAAGLGLDLAQCAVVGDKESDVGLAHAIGGPAFLVLTGKGERTRAAGTKADFVEKDLPAVAKRLAALMDLPGQKA